VRQPHELDELEERRRRVAETDRAAASRGCELQPRERIDGHRVRLDAGNVAANDISRRGEEGADPIAEARKVGARDRAANREGDLVRSGCRHRPVDDRGCRNSAVLDERGRYM
jgi:hypothetical protein